jgi:tol-pal system protein YbgF
MSTRKQSSWLMLAVLCAGGCALMPVPPEEDPVLIRLTELENRLQNIERIVQGQSLVNLTQQVSAIERHDDELQGRLDELEHGSETTAERQRQLYMDLDSRIQQLEASVKERSSVNVMDGGALPAGQLPVPNGSDRDNYQAALELLKAERYQPAAAAFQQFLVAFPNSERADNAQYWLAETHYVTTQFQTALKEFELVINKYADSRKVPDALLKMGYCYYELKRWDDARASLTRVQTEYPETTAARLAGQRLQRMQDEGV